MIWHSKHVPITFKFRSEVGFEKCSKFYWNHFFDLIGMRRTYKNCKNQKSNFSKNQKPYNFFVFWATTTIHTFLKSSYKTVIIMQGQIWDIATGKGSGAKFSLYRQTHCRLFMKSRLLDSFLRTLLLFDFPTLCQLQLCSKKRLCVQLT